MQRFFQSWLARAGALALVVFALGACSATPPSAGGAHTGSGASGVTVYGTVDAGVGRTSR
ncbi:MAG: hypothetical protein Q4F13_05060 [Pseudomonadota bacterium]|nr:hypothetical protein [Pseudomonadota bacterium]